MARTGVGAITITDISDGIHPISMVLSNQSHTFSADYEGTVTAAEKNKFSCTVFAYVGDTRATYDSSSSPAKVTYDVAITDDSGWVSATTVVDDQLVISLTTIPTGVTNTSGNLELVISVTNYLGNTTDIEATISLSKIIAGMDGTVITLTPSRQTFQFDEDGVTTDGDISIDVSASGAVGTLSAFYSRNGSTSWSTLTLGTTANHVKSLDIDGTSPDTIVLSSTNFGSSDVFTIKVSGSTGGSDVVSFIHIQDGNTGAAAIVVTISSSTGGFVFKNNTGTAKTLTAKVYDMANGNQITSGVTYQWMKNGSALSGKTSSTLVVTASDITDDSSEEYSCAVTVS